MQISTGLLQSLAHILCAMEALERATEGKDGFTQRLWRYYQDSNDSVSVLSKISRVNRERLGGPTHPLLTNMQIPMYVMHIKQHELLLPTSPRVSTLVPKCNCKNSNIIEFLSTCSTSKVSCVSHKESSKVSV